MKDALGAAVEDAVVIFVAVAAGLGVLNDHVMVGELLVAREVKAVQDALDAFIGKAGADIVARKLGAGGDGMGDEIAVAAQVDVNGGDVIGCGVFVLELAVLDDGVFADDEFFDRVRKIGRAGGADAAPLNYRQAAAFFCDDEIARVRGRAGLGSSGYKEQMDGLRNGDARGHVNERAVAEESGIKRRESVVLGGGVLAEMFFEEAQQVALQRGGEAADFDAVRERKNGGQFTGKMGAGRKRGGWP